MTDNQSRKNSAFSESEDKNSPKWFNQWLQQRGILETALKMQWKPHVYKGSRGGSYPVFDPIMGNTVSQRWKAAPNQRGAKYSWPNGTGSKGKAKYYAAPGLLDAIAAADGVLFVANGEPSVLAFHAAGIENVLSWFGESSIPASIVKDFTLMNVDRVIYLPDNDMPGYKAAIKLRDMLQGSGLDYEFKTWGLSQIDRLHVDKKSGKETPYIACDDIPEKTDANDYWIQVAFDPAKFADRLQHAAPLILPAPEKQPRESFDDSDYEDTPAGLIQAIIAAAKSRGYKGQGDFINGNCLFPENHKNGVDRNGSAGIAQDSGVLNCHVPGCGSHGHWEVAERLGIDPSQYYTQRSNNQNTAAESYDYRKLLSQKPGQVWFSNGIPDSWRSLLLNYMGKTHAAIFELANEAARIGVLNASHFCIDDLIDSMKSTQFCMSAKTIRNQFSELKTEFFPESDTLNTDVRIDRENTLSDFGNNPLGGRPTTYYSFQSQACLYEILLERARVRIIESVLPANSKKTILPKFTSKMLQAEGIDLPSEQAAIAANMLNKHETVSKIHNREAQIRENAKKKSDGKFRRLKESLTNTESTFLLSEPIKNGVAYRDLFYKSKLAAEGTSQRSRADIADLVGIRSQQVTALHKRVKAESREHKPEVKVSSVKEIKELTSRAYPLYITVTDTTTGEIIRTPNVEDRDIYKVANEAIENQNIVKVCLQMPNIQELKSASKRLYEAIEKYLLICWFASQIDTSVIEHTPDQLEDSEPEETLSQKELFPDKHEQGDPETTEQLPKAIKPGQYYRVGHDPAWVAEHLNRVLLNVDSPYRARVFKLIGSDEAIQYRVRIVTISGQDVGRVTDKLLMQALYFDPVEAEAIALGGIAR